MGITRKLITVTAWCAPFFLFFFWLFFLNHIAVQEIGISYNSWNGRIVVQEQPGWYITNIFVRVASVSTLPIQVCLNSGARILNCKLVRFKKEGVEEFVRDQGFHYYENTNWGWGDVTNCTPSCIGLPNILKGYAYSGRRYSFLEILEEIAPHSNSQVQ